MQMPLEGVRALDLSHALAGPFCSTMLADFGAEVIKLEPRGAGDISRAWGTPLPGGETSYFMSLHRNKKGIEVDLKHARGKELFFRLMERSDVVLENYRTGALERLGLGSNSRTPSSRSRSWTCRDSAGCVTPSRVAAPE
jgi:crotonobetainyl-CoA:carnitine CoA-transferase CaiB-like acyl-CoA transferase